MALESLVTIYYTILRIMWINENQVKKLPVQIQTSENFAELYEKSGVMV